MEVYVVRLMKNHSSVVGTEFYRVLARIVVIFLFVSDSYLVWLYFHSSFMPRYILINTEIEWLIYGIQSFWNSF